MKVIINGYLYNGYVIQDNKNIANSNAHVPSLNEVNALITYLGGIANGGKIKENDLNYWTTLSGVTNDYGFSLRGSGYRHNGNGTCYGIKQWAYLWTNSVSANGYNTLNTYYTSNQLQTGDTNIKQGCSVRLIIDAPTEISGDNAIYVGNDGQRYKCVKINGVWWLAENLLETKYRDGSSITLVTDPAVWIASTSGAYCAYNNDESQNYSYVEQAVPASVTASVTVQPNKNSYTGTIVVSDPIGAYEYSLDGLVWQSSPTFTGVHFGSYTVKCRIVGNIAYTSSNSVTVNEYQFAFNKKQVTIQGADLLNDGVNGTFGGNVYYDFESNYNFPLTVEIYSKFTDGSGVVTENLLNTTATNSQTEGFAGNVSKSVSTADLENNFNWELYAKVIYNDGAVQSDIISLCSTEKTGAEIKQFRTLNVTGSIYPNYCYDGVDFQVQTSDLVGGQIFGLDILNKNIFAIELFDKNLASIGVLNCYCISKGTSNFTLFIPQLAFQFRKFKLLKIGQYYLNNPLEKDSNNGYPMLDDYRLQVLTSGSQVTQNRGIRFTNLYNIVTQITLTFDQPSNPGTVKYYTTYIDREREIGHTFNIYDHYVHDGILKSLFEWKGNGEYRLISYEISPYGGYTNYLARPVYYNMDSSFTPQKIYCDYRIDVNFQFGTSTKKQLNINDPMTKDEVVHVFKQYDSSVHDAKLNRYFITNSLKNKGILFLKNAVLFGTNDTTKATAVFKLGGIQVYKSDEIYAQVFELLFDEVTITGGTMNAIVYEPKFN